MALRHQQHKLQYSVFPLPLPKENQWQRYQSGKNQASQIRGHLNFFAGHAETKFFIMRLPNFIGAANTLINGNVVDCGGQSSALQKPAVFYQRIFWRPVKKRHILVRLAEFNYRGMQPGSNLQPLRRGRKRLNPEAGRQVPAIHVLKIAWFKNQVCEPVLKWLGPPRKSRNPVAPFYQKPPQVPARKPSRTKRILVG